MKNIPKMDSSQNGGNNEVTVTTTDLEVGLNTNNSTDTQNSLDKIKMFNENNREIKASNNQDECENLKVCFTGSCICLLGTAFFGGCIANVVFCIIALCEVSFRTTQNRCPGSTLWIYLLISMIIHGSAAKNSKQEKDNLPAALVCNIAFVIAFASWGTYELWGRPEEDKECNLDDLLIYTMASVQVIVSWVLILIFIVIMLIICCK